MNASIAAVATFMMHHPPRAGLIIDFSQVVEITPTQRKAFADHEERIGELSRLYVIRCGYVVATPLIRAALTAYLWIWQPTYPYRVFDDRAAAEDWVLAAE